MSDSNFCFLTCIQVSQEAGLVFPSLEEFSTVCCNPHSQNHLGSGQNYPQEKEMKKAKWLSEAVLQIVEKRREALQ